MTTPVWDFVENPAKDASLQATNPALPTEGNQVSVIPWSHVDARYLITFLQNARLQLAYLVMP